MLDFEVSLVWERNIESIKRHLKGTPILETLEDPKTTDIMLNPDGKLWVERLNEPMSYLGSMEQSKAEAFVRVVAGCQRREITAEKPLLKCKFPLDGSRFSCAIQPVVESPAFAIRKHALNIFTLDDYVASGAMTLAQKQVLEDAIVSHQNILVSGGTSSGKTTLTNSLIDAMTKFFPHERFLIGEEVGELQCKGSNTAFFSMTDEVDMTRIIESFLTLRPNRICIGEVKDGSALDLMDAWSTGHPGGICTFHGNNAVDSLDRLRGLISRNKYAPREIEPLIGRAANILVYMGYEPPEGRKIKEIIRINGFSNGKYDIDHLAI